MVSKDEFKALLTRSRELGDPPAYVSTTKVRLKSESLSRPIYWTGRQWAVTEYGVECRDGTYAIARECIWEEGGYTWVQHMGEKEWVDLPDFVEALRLARQRWPEFVSDDIPY